MSMFGVSDASLSITRGMLPSIAILAAERVASQSAHERHIIRSVVWEFVKFNNRIVYGGAALHALLDESDDGDIEFYSSCPGRDIIEICDQLRSLNSINHHFIQGREAIHLSTLTVSAQFKRCCDVTYMHPLTESTIPCITKDGVRSIHPHIMMIDMLRMLTEPDASYWRIEKAFNTVVTLEQNFPLSWDDGGFHPVDSRCTRDSPLLESLLSGRVVAVGAHAVSFFESALGEPDTRAPCPGPLQLVCIDYVQQVRAARESLHNFGHAGGDEVCREAFGDFLGRSTVFLDKSGCCILEMIDAYPRCVPCAPGDSCQPGTFVASSLFCFVTAMACHLRAFITGDKQAVSEQSIVCTRLLASRQSALSLATVPPVFEDFGLDHILGQTTSDIHVHVGTNKSWLKYNPSIRYRDSAQCPRRRMWQTIFAPRTGRVKSITSIS